MVLVEDLDTLEAVMGRPLPAHIRDELIAESRCYPFTPGMREAWREESAFGITETAPERRVDRDLWSAGRPEPLCLPMAARVACSDLGPWHLQPACPGGNDRMPGGVAVQLPAADLTASAARNQDARGLPPANPIDLEA